MHTNPAVRFCKRRHFSAKNFFHLAIILSLPFVMAGKAAAQYGGGGGTSGGGSGSSNGTYVPPKGGYSSATGAAAGATGLFLALHYRGRLVGCVQLGEDGLRLLDESKNKSYALLPETFTSGLASAILVSTNTVHCMRASIASRVLPLVSGKRALMKRNPAKQIAA